MSFVSTGTKLTSVDDSLAAIVLTDNKVIVTKGYAVGQVLKLEDWLIIAPKRAAGLVDMHSEVVIQAEKKAQVAAEEMAWRARAEEMARWAAEEEEEEEAWRARAEAYQAMAEADLALAAVQVDVDDTDAWPAAWPAAWATHMPGR